MKWNISGIDPSKPSKDNGRVIYDSIIAPSITGAVATFCNRYPMTVQLSIIRSHSNDSESVAA